MQVRKLVKSGYASLVMAVPKDWLKKNKLKAGDIVYVNDETNNLVISTQFKEKQSEKKEIVINVTKKDPQIIAHEIRSAYLNNYYHIIIKGEGLNKVAKSIKEHIVKLVALELIEESSEKIVARSFLNLYDIDLKTIIRRMDNIVRSMMIDTKECLKDATIAENIIDRDEEVNRLSFLVFKILKIAYTDDNVLRSIDLQKEDILKYWELTIHLEKIGDRVKNISKTSSKLTKQYHNQYIKLFEEIGELYKLVMKAFYQNSIELSNQVSIKKKDMNQKIKSYIKESKRSMCSEIAVNAFNMTSNINDISRIIRFLNYD
tara:strand:- start:661 stop:1611 length:951 start_codon:yes stop_codon:yes gene_type:complete